MILTVVDDHSRVAYAEIHHDEIAVTAAAVSAKAVAWCAERGITVERGLSDNGSAYRLNLWRKVGTDLGVSHATPGNPTEFLSCFPQYAGSKSHSL